ncbi:MAG: hypothetical protein AB1798_16975 [Spirochaetota bacterium]
MKYYFWLKKTLKVVSLYMKDERYETAEVILQECFWGDYHITPEELLKRFDSGDIGFKRFIFSKVLSNSSHPSRHLRNIFTAEEVRALLDRTAISAERRRNRRLSLIRANILEMGEEIPGYSWRKK